VAGRDETRDDSLERAATHVRERYPSALRGGPLVALGNRGGFSGARLWQGVGVAGRFSLRAWPADRTAASVRHLHLLMDHARRLGLDFVPAVYAANDGATAIEEGGRVWELTQWLEGNADFAEHPASERLDAACEALARLHRAWGAFCTPQEPCPAVRRRLKVLADWRALVSTGWQLRAPLETWHDPVWPVAEQAWRRLPGWLDHVSGILQPWINFVRPVQPCLCDLWHDHVLFDGNRVTGLLDYGAVKLDHVAVDLSRMLGSLVPGNVARWQRGLQTYLRIRPLDDHEVALVGVLDRTGTILGIVNWLRWLYHEDRRYEDRSAIARRLESMLNRIESWGLGTLEIRGFSS
jgi:homoserine kinase type II